MHIPVPAAVSCGRRALLLGAATAMLVTSSACLGSLLPTSTTATNVELEKNKSLAAGNTTAREQLVKNHLMALKNAQQFYFAKHGRYGSMEDLVAEGQLNRPSDGLGYDVEISVGSDGSTYTISATPKTYGPSGKQSYFMDESGTIRAADKGGDAADASDPAV